MFFTKEDIDKIYKALGKLSIKDSEFKETNVANINDTLTIIQGEENRKINLKDFFNSISLFKKEGFLNITERFNRPNISLIQAINLVPIHQRIDGLVITFQDINDDWRIYQFRGNSNEFTNENKWLDLYDYTNYIVKSIVPDEEDLTVSKPDKNGNSVVSLKDRVYDKSNFSGKGYKILRKNIQVINGVKKNVITQDMINKSNTIYEIRYDFDLGGNQIVIQDNCVLYFLGGSFTNGTIIGTSTKIQANSYKIFQDINIKGNFISDLNAMWIGALPNNESCDNSQFIIKWWKEYIKCGFNKIYFPHNTYYFHSTIQLTPNAMYATIDGNNSNFISNIQDGAFIYNYTKESYNEYLTISNVIFKSNVKNKSIAICIQQSNMWTINNVQIWNFEYGIKLIDTYYGVFNGFNSIRGCRVGIITKGNNTQEINTIDFRNIKINPCPKSTILELYPMIDITEEDWYIKYGSCGIDAYTAFLDCKFEGLTIENCDYAMRFNRIPLDKEASYSALININQCYFENNKKYDIYFGKGNTTSIGYNQSEYVVNIKQCLFNKGGNILVSEGVFNIKNIGGLSKILNINNKTTNYPLFINTDSDNKYVGKWDNQMIFINGSDSYSKYPAFDNNSYQRFFYQKLQKGLSNFFIGNTPKLGNVDSELNTSLRKIPSVTSIFSSSIKLEDVFFQNSIGFGSIVNDNTNRILLPSGNQTIVKPQLSFGYNAYSKGFGIPFYILYKYFIEGTEYKGYVQEVFNDEIYIDHSTKTIKKVSDDTIIGYGKEFLLTEPVFPNGTILYNVETGMCNIYISAQSSFMKYADYIRSYVKNTDCIIGYNFTKELLDKLPNKAMLNDIVLLKTDKKYYIYNGYKWVEFTKITQRYYYKSWGSGLKERMSSAECRGQTYINIDTGMVYAYTGEYLYSKAIYSNWVSISIGVIEKFKDLLSDYQIGDVVFCKDLNKLIIWNGTKWIDSNGNNATLSIGTTEIRPSNASTGYLYYDTTLKKYIVWNGTKWVNIDGTVL